LLEYFAIPEKWDFSEFPIPFPNPSVSILKLKYLSKLALKLLKFAVITSIYRFTFFHFFRFCPKSQRWGHKLSFGKFVTKE